VFFDALYAWYTAVKGTPMLQADTFRPINVSVFTGNLPDSGHRDSRCVFSTISPEHTFLTVLRVLVSVKREELRHDTRSYIPCLGCPMVPLSFRKCE
jgi:hypothetical protein